MPIVHRMVAGFHTHNEHFREYSNHFSIAIVQLTIIAQFSIQFQFVFACLLAFAAASPAPAPAPAPGALLARQLYTAPLAYSYAQPSYIASAPLAYSSYSTNLAYRTPLTYSAAGLPAITYL